MLTCVLKSHAFPQFIDFTTLIMMFHNIPHLGLPQITQNCCYIFKLKL